MRCIGRTKSFSRCKKNCRFILCHQHRLQWLVVFTFSAFVGGYYQDVILPIQSCSRTNEHLYTDEKSLDSITILTKADYYRDFAQGLHFMNTGKRNLASKSLHRALKKFNSRPSVVKDIEYWLGMNSAMHDDYQLLYEFGNKYLKDTADELRLKAYLKSIYYYNMDDHRNYTKSVREINRIDEEVLPLGTTLQSDIVANDLDSFEDHICSRPFTIYDDSYFRKEQGVVWGNILGDIIRTETEFFQSVALGRLMSVSPEKTAIEAFCYYNPIGNYYYSLMEYRDHYKSIWNRSSFSCGSETEIYQEFIEFGMQLGSHLAVRQFLRDKKASEELINSLTIDLPSLKNSISFIARDISDSKVDLLYSYTSQSYENRTEYQTKVEQFEFLLIEVDIASQEYKFIEVGTIVPAGFNPYWMKVIPLNKSIENKYAVIFSSSTTESKDVFFIDSLGQVLRYEVKQEKYNYHTEFVSCWEDSSQVYMKWFYEFDNICEGNAKDKIRGEAIFRVDHEKRQLIVIADLISNTAVKFWEKVDDTEFQLQSAILDRFVVGEVNISDAEFIRDFKEFDVCYIRSATDMALESSNQILRPSISALYLDLGETVLSDPNMYLLLVREKNNFLYLLDIFRVEDRELRSIIERK